MNNIVFIIIDSLSYDRIYQRGLDKKLVPFLNSKKGELIMANNLFSQGPYTEAGTKGLLCSCDTLDNGGYFLRYDSEKKFITDYFKEVGYETYNINSPSYLLSKRTIDNIDHMIYTSGFDCRFLWSQRFEFYYDRWNSGKFSRQDYSYLAKFVKLVFETSEDFFEGDYDDEKYEPIKDILDMGVFRENRRILQDEKKKFEENFEEYIDSIFTLKLNHPIFKVKNIDLPKMIKTKQINMALRKRRKFIKKFRKIQFWNNLRNNKCTKYVVKRTIKAVLKDGKITKSNSGEVINRIRNLISARELDVYKTGLYYTNDPYKLAPSARTQFDYACSILEKSEENNKFIFLHPEEPHYFNTFFSYDVPDEKLILDELDMAEEVINDIGSDYKGSLFYDLSVRYIDKQIENLYYRLEKCGKLKDTLVVITADHGSSYFFDPIRSTLVNNMHSENYHVPLYIFGKGVSGCEFKQMCMGKDVIPTIAELSDIKLKSEYKGHSLLDDSYNSNSIMIEFMGPGCPDIRLKPVWLSARTLEYAVSYIGYLKDNFDEMNITEIYDLIADPLEKVNIVELRNEKINELINSICKRFEELRIELLRNEEQMYEK